MDTTLNPIPKPQTGTHQPMPMIPMRPVSGGYPGYMPAMPAMQPGFTPGYMTSIHGGGGGVGGGGGGMVQPVLVYGPNGQPVFFFAFLFYVGFYIVYGSHVYKVLQ